MIVAGPLNPRDEVSHAELLVVTQNLVLDGLLVPDEEAVPGEVFQGAAGAFRRVEAERGVDAVFAGEAVAAFVPTRRRAFRRCESRA